MFLACQYNWLLGLIMEDIPSEVDSAFAPGLRNVVKSSSLELATRRPTLEEEALSCKPER